MNNKEAIDVLKRHLHHWERLLQDGICNEKEGKETIEALELAIKVLEFQEQFTDIVAQAVVNSGCDSLEEFCEKIGVHIEEAENEQVR